MSSEQEFPLPVWIDCDPGHDDMFGLLMADNLPSLFKLVGISTVFGNSTIQNVTSNTLKIKQVFKLSQTAKIYLGANEPFGGKADAGEDLTAPSIHGVSGLEGSDYMNSYQIIDDNGITRVEPEPAVDALHKAIQQYPGKLHLVFTGCLTNLAELAQKYPEDLKSVARVAIMGGGFDGYRNWTPYAEFNILIDSKAAKIVFENPALQGKLFLAPLNITHEVIATDEVVKRTLGSDVPPVHRQVLHDLMLFFGNTYKKEQVEFQNGPPVHDPVALVSLLYGTKYGDSLGFKVKKGKVSVEAEHDNPRNGETTLEESDTPGTVVFYDMDVDAFWNLFYECLNNLDNKLKSG